MQSRDAVVLIEGAQAPLLYGVDMKIQLLRSTFCDGKHCKTGAVVEASAKDGSFLVNSGAAVKVEDVQVETKPVRRGRKKSPTNRMIDPEEIENRDAGE